MRIISMFPPRFFAADGETITVNVTAQNPNMVFLVKFKIGATTASVQQGNPIQFTMSSASPQSILALELGFQPADGTGAYAVRITGDTPGGATFQDTFDGKFGVDPLIVPFEFLSLDF